MGGMAMILLFGCLYKQQSRCRVSSGESSKWDIDGPSINA